MDQWDRSIYKFNIIKGEYTDDLESYSKYSKYSLVTLIAKIPPSMAWRKISQFTKISINQNIAFRFVANANIYENIIVNYNCLLQLQLISYSRNLQHNFVTVRYVAHCTAVGAKSAAANYTNYWIQNTMAETQAMKIIHQQKSATTQHNTTQHFIIIVNDNPNPLSLQDSTENIFKSFPTK